MACKNGVFELLSWMVEPLVESDDKALQAALVKVSTHFGLTGKSRPVIVALGGRGTLVRYVDMPKMSAQDLRRMFAFESDKYFPFPKDTVYTDCHVLETQDSGKKMAVLVTAVKKEILDGRLKLLKESGVDPCAVSLNSVAIANAFQAFSPAGFCDGPAGREFKACAVIDIGEAGSSLMIIYAGMPRFNRDIFIGTQEILKRASNIMGIPPAEVKLLLSATRELKEPVQKNIDTVMAGLISEIRLSFDYFTTEKNLAVTQIFLTGEGALLGGVEKAFKTSIDIPVGDWDPFVKVSVLPAVAGEALKLNGTRLVTALGLALNEYD